jgi:hypothetical protein
LLTKENLAASARQWQSLDLRRRAEPVAEHCRLSPSTCSLLAQHAATLSPMGQAKFSALIGGSHIFPHAGPSNGRLRVHLGLYVPEHGYVISVDGVNATWVPGQALVLDDSLVHEVFAPPAARAPPPSKVCPRARTQMRAARRSGAVSSGLLCGRRRRGCRRRVGREARPAATPARSQGRCEGSACLEDGTGARSTE